MPAPDRNTPFRTESFSLKVPNGLWGYYTDAETDALVAGLAAGGGTVDLTAHDGATPSPAAPTPAGLEEAFAGYADGLHYFKGSGAIVSITRQPFQTTVVVNGAVRSVARIVKSEAGLATPQNPSVIVQSEADGKWMKLASDELTKPFAPVGMVDLFALPTGTVDLAGVAKVDDKDQLLVSKTVTAQAFAFGDTNPARVGLTYTDTNQGYGERLVLAVGLTNEYLVYASDLDAVKARVETLESKAAPAVDLAPYVTLETADATYGRKDALDLLRSQTQTIFDSIYTRAEADARYAAKATTYTKVECDAKFLTLVDVNGVYATKAELTATNPTAASSINDPALAAFKASVMDEVKKMMAGGKTVPADIDWTVCPSVAGAGTIEARVLNGIIQLRGEITISISATGSFTQVRKLPANFPKPLAEYNCLVYGIQTGSTYRRVFVRWAPDGSIAICPDGTMTAATLTGATAYAY